MAENENEIPQVQSPDARQNPETHEYDVDGLNRDLDALRDAMKDLERRGRPVPENVKSAASIPGVTRANAGMVADQIMQARKDAEAQDTNAQLVDGVATAANAGMAEAAVGNAAAGPLGALAGIAAILGKAGISGGQDTSEAAVDFASGIPVGPNGPPLPERKPEMARETGRTRDLPPLPFGGGNT